MIFEAINILIIFILIFIEELNLTHFKYKIILFYVSKTFSYDSDNLHI
jgi:hypothetical protein